MRCVQDGHVIMGAGVGRSAVLDAVGVKIEWGQVKKPLCLSSLSCSPLDAPLRAVHETTQFNSPDDAHDDHHLE
jgi:hypothetical protein